MDRKQLAELAKVFVRRAMRGDLQQERARDDERAALQQAQPPCTDPLVQDYAAWRRALLGIAATALTLTTLIALFDHRWFAAEGEMGKVLGLLQWVLLLANGVGAVCVAFAMLRWTDLPRSRLLARSGWLVMFLTPLAIAVVPWPRVVGGGGDAAARAAQVALGLQLGIGLFLHIAPNAIALFVGASRSAMTLKTLLPEHPAPGWMAAIVGPLYAVFLVAMIAILNQVTGNLLLVAGVVCLMISPLLLVRRARDLLRPHTNEEAAAIVRQLRNVAALCNAAGVVLFAIWIVGLETFSVLNAIEFVLAMAGSVTLLTVVGADVVLALLYRGFQQAQQFQGSALADALARKFEPFAAVGLTELRSRRGAPPAASA
jgi:hypothetical protein